MRTRRAITGRRASAKAAARRVRRARMQAGAGRDVLVQFLRVPEIVSGHWSPPVYMRSRT